MKSRVVYLFLLFIIAIGIIVGFKSLNRREFIKQGNSQNIDYSVWNSVISNNINNTLITLNIDGNQLRNDINSIYMNDGLTLMIPVGLISDAFDCAVNIYDNKTILMEKGLTTLKFVVDSYVMTQGHNAINLKNSPTVLDGEIFIPIDAVQAGFGYEYTWNGEQNLAMLTSVDADQISLPYYYNYLDNGRVPCVKNQGRYGTCWAFASLTALETTLLPEEALIFSEDHMSLNSAYKLSQNFGGDYTMSMAYLASWKGPVLESEDKYGDGKTIDELTAVKHVQEIQLIKPKDYEAIKKMIYKNGGVQSSLYTTMKNAKSGDNRYFNKSTNSYCYIGTQKPNHDIVIIGWDDNYPKENFNADLEGDGAFICRNSWGEDFGDHGNFYVSYYDSVIGIHNVAYTKVEENNNYDTIYQSDLCGWVGQLGYGKEEAYFANVYTSKGTQELEAVSFYATDRDTEYSVYICENFIETNSLNILKKADASGTFANAGYYTVKLNEPIALGEGQKFAIIVKINTPNSTRPIAIEYINNEKTTNVDLEDGEGYISLRGFDWESVEQKHACNLCLKAFTTNK